jgi:hypothetical protein
MKKIILISLAAILFAGIGGYLGCYFSYNNQEITLRTQAEAQRGKVDVVSIRKQDTTTLLLDKDL